MRPVRPVRRREEEQEDDEEEIIPVDVVRGPGVAIGGSTSSNVVDTTGRQIQQDDDAAPLQFLSMSSWKKAMEKGRLRYKDEEEERWRKPTIFLVPEWMKDKESKAYKPELVSLGPYHHGDPNLLPMERHKHRAVQTMLGLPQHGQQEPQRSPLEFFRAIEWVADTLLEAYHDLDPSWRYGAKRNYFIRIMVNDGCFLLEFVKAVKSLNTGKRGSVNDYAPNDPVFSMRGLISNLVLGFFNFNDDGELFNHDDLCMHPLDIFHRSLCGPRLKSTEWHGWVDTVPSAVKLGEAGIHFKRSNTNKLCDIDFKNGVLSMPRILVGYGTKKEFLNLMAFEHLHRDIVTDVSVTNYVFFMDNIIDTEADVELLKKREVIEHTLGTNMEVANLFNNMKRGAMMSPYGKLAQVKGKVNIHCKKTLYKWRASFIQTYLRTPWVFVSLVVAVILLIATLLQTVYTVLPYYTKG
nr:unnamed protein product [Digitaria exilis]